MNRKYVYDYCYLLVEYGRDLLSHDYKIMVAIYVHWQNQGAQPATNLTGQLTRRMN
jgi:hypothetical protein